MKEILIDSEKFAYSVIESTIINSDKLNNDQLSKEKLYLFLSAYILAEKFNDLEKKDLRNKDMIEETLNSIKFTQ